MSSTALAIVEQSQVAREVGGLTRQLMSLLPGEESVRRFQRVTIQALVKNPDLLECTTDSVLQSVMEAAAMGLEPTGSVGGAHLVPYNVNVAPKGKPARYEKRAQLIPDYRGVVRLVTRPRADGSPSEVVSVEARVVKEGDAFSYTLGSDARVEHVPSLSPSRSSKPTTHVYMLARLRSGGTVLDVEDHAGIERVRAKGRKQSFSPWDSDWDEMAKKTIVKRGAKLLPVEPDVRAILAREDELPAPEPPAAAASVQPSRTRQLAARLRPEPEPDPAQDAPQQAQEPEAGTDTADESPEPRQAEDGAVREVCGAESDPALGDVLLCVMEPGHDKPHTGADGSRWPNRKGGRP